MRTVLTDYPWVLLALTLWREARGCTHEAKVAIAHVICNRAADPRKRWPGTLAGVLTQPMQFTSIAPPVHITPAEMSNATSWPKDGDAQFAECCAIADQFSTGTEPFDDTLGATNYFSEPIPAVPEWAIPSRLTVRIGPFSFYKL